MSDVANISMPRVRGLTFWHFQIGGWMLLWSSDIALMLMRPSLTVQAFLIEVLEVPVGFLLSLLLRQIYRRVHYARMGIFALLAYLLVWSMIFTTLFYSGIVLVWLVLGSPEYVRNLLYYKVAIQWLNHFLPIWIGWSALYFGIRYWRDWEGEKERARQAMALAQRAQLQMLRYQVNPHFLFNALNSLRALIDEDKNNAKAMVGELRDFLGYAITEPDAETRTLRNELDAIRHYLAIEKKRFEDKLEVSFDISAEAESIPLPSFLIHPLVENAVKHGMNTSPLPLRIGIHASRGERGLRVSVRNSGRWIGAVASPSNGSTGTGLENVRARLRHAYPERHRLEIREHGDAVEVLLELGIDGARNDPP